MNATPRIWTTEEDALLVRLREENKSNKDICRILDRRIGSVEKRLQRLGLTKPQNPAPEVQCAESATKPQVLPPVLPPLNDKFELVRLWRAANRRQAEVTK